MRLLAVLQSDNDCQKSTITSLSSETQPEINENLLKISNFFDNPEIQLRIKHEILRL
jgi:hypothetical protein